MVCGKQGGTWYETFQGQGNGEFTYLVHFLGLELIWNWIVRHSSTVHILYVVKVNKI